MRTEPAHVPASTQLNEWIETAHRPADDRLVENFGWPLVIFRPIASGGNQGLGLASDSAAAPVGDGDIALVPQTSQTCHATSHAIRQVPSRHQMLDRVDRTDR